MSLTRKFLKALGLEEDKIEEIITAHSETVTALKEQIETYKADAEKLPAVQAALDKVKTNDGEQDAYKVKYEALKEDFDKYKSEIAGKEVAAKKQAAYRALLAECKISEKRHDAITKLADLSTIELDENGTIKGADKIKAALVAEWADFVETTSTKPTTVPTPPSQKPDAITVLQQQYEAAQKRGDHVGAMAAMNQIKKAKKE